MGQAIPDAAGRFVEQQREELPLCVLEKDLAAMAGDPDIQIEIATIN